MSAAEHKRLSALEQYEMAIALGAHSLVQAERFADLRGAHNARMAELVAAEEADAPDEWVTINGMPGASCKTCGMPTESEPCEQHQPSAYARCNA